MRRIAPLLMAALFAAGLLAAVAYAGQGHHPGICVPQRGKHCPGHPGTTTGPSTTTTAPPTTTTAPPTTTEPPVTAPMPNPSLPTESFCVQTVERGNTFVQAGPDSFKSGGDWYVLWTSNARVVLDGQTVTLQYEDGNGLILAANVPGVGLTCDQPYVSATMKYADPSYGQR